MNLETILRAAPVIPVVIIDDLRDAIPLARALVAGGLPVIEITLRTAVGLEALRAISAEVPEAIVGAGTVLTAALQVGLAGWSTDLATAYAKARKQFGRAA